MTTGAVILAFDNEEIDYVAMAAWSADRIHRHLDIPVCLITDRSINDPVFDRVIEIERATTTSQRHFEDLPRSVTWYNHDRIEIFDLSPWDRTLVLDADYVVASDALCYVLDSNQEFANFGWAFDVTQPSGRLEHLNYFGSNRMPMMWATAMVFDRSRLAQMIFDCMRMIRDNWRHYCDIYGIGRSAYRNDFALTIARLIVNGHVLPNAGIQHDMACVLPSHRLEQIDEDAFRMTWQDGQGKRRYITTSGQDLHAMCKGSLGEIVAHKS